MSNQISTTPEELNALQEVAFGIGALATKLMLSTGTWSALDKGSSSIACHYSDLNRIAHDLHKIANQYKVVTIPAEIERTLVKPAQYQTITVLFQEPVWADVEIEPAKQVVVQRNLKTDFDGSPFVWRAERW